MDADTFSQKYIDTLETTFEGLNLTRIDSLDDFKIKQYEDSVLPFKKFQSLQHLIEKSDKVLDIGFGGGFPILPLASLNPDKQFLGLDSKRKKADAVMEISRQLEIKNVETIHGRMEDYLIASGTLVTVKAVGPIYRVCKQLKTEKNTTIIFYKGPKFFTEELKDFETIQSDWSIIIQEEYQLSNGDKRVIVVVKSKNVPRRTNLERL